MTQQETQPTEVVDPFRQQLAHFYDSEVAMLDDVAAFEVGEFYYELINPTTEVVNNPESTHALTTVVSEIRGLRGFNPLRHADGVTLEIERTIDDICHTQDILPSFGIDTNISLTVGIYGDIPTHESMEAYIADNPAFETRLFTRFVFDKEGNSVKSFVVPADFPLEDKEGRVVVPDSKEKIVYDSLESWDLEMIGFSIDLLQRAFKDRE